MSPPTSPHREPIGPFVRCPECRARFSERGGPDRCPGCGLRLHPETKLKREPACFTCGATPRLIDHKVCATCHDPERCPTCSGRQPKHWAEHQGRLRKPGVKTPLV